MYLYLSPNLPSVESLRDVKFQTPLRIYSADNKLIGEHGERRVPVKLAEMSPLLIKAFIAAEDDSFYSHNGFDLMSFMRATSYYVLNIDGGGGASTLTMQVAKNSFLEDDQAQLLFDNKDNNSFLKNDGSILYKFVQILLALKIETVLTKDEILEIYLNQIFLGHRSYGVQAAARTYYDKDVSQLTLAQAAVIAGIPTGPSVMNPITSPERALNRRSYVLKRMLDDGYIDQTQYEDAKALPISARYSSTSPDVNAAYVNSMARSYMEETYGKNISETAGYRVYTTIDSRFQDAAQRAVVNGLIAYDERHGYRGPEARLQPVYYSAQNRSDEESEEAEQEITHLYPPMPVEDSDLDLAAEQTQEIQHNPSPQEDISPQRLLLNPWLAELRSRPTYGEFRAAAVVKSESTMVLADNEAGETIETPQHTIEAVLATGEIINIPWENGPSTAKPASGGSNPKDTSFLQVGDVIRVHQNRGRAWQLVQLPEAQAAFVALNPDTGAIKALVGGFDYYHHTWNRIMQAERQPGSNMKPFVYAYALENGYSPATIVNDAPRVSGYDKNLEGVWRPSNAGNKYLGLIPLREGFYKSQNMVAVRVLEELILRDDLSLRDFFNSLERFGFDKTKFYDDQLSSALGAEVLRPIDLATGYAAFANGGYKVEHFYIDRIELEGEGIIYEADFPVVCRECERLAAEEELVEEEVLESAAEEISDALDEDSPFADFLADVEEAEIEEVLPTNIAPRIMEDRIVFLMHDMMQDVIRKGTGRRARALGRSDLAGKTGTTDSSTENNTNAWFSGYANGIVATTWIGFDENKPLGYNEQGAVSALPMWIEFMRTALAGVPEKYIEQPPGVVRVRVNKKTGLQSNNPEHDFDYFLEENVPEYGDPIQSTTPIFDREPVKSSQDIF